MYRCGVTGVTTEAGQGRMLIVEYRMAEHGHRRGVNKKFVFERGRRQEKWVDDVGGHGYQIAREIPVCRTVYDRYLNWKKENGDEFPTRVPVELFGRGSRY